MPSIEHGAAHQTVITTFEPQAGGTQVSFRCEDVPPGIGEADHEAGMASTLANLAAFAEAG